MPGGAPWGLPEPTKKKVKPQDVIGEWQLGGTVTVLFRPDGKFTQTVSDPNGTSTTTEGTWKLDGPNVMVEGYLSHDTGEREDMSWYMVDDHDGKLALYCGDCPDADLWAIRRRLPGSG